MFPSSGETTVFTRHFVLVILTQVDSLKLKVRVSFYDIHPCNFKLSNDILRNKRTKKSSTPSWLYLQGISMFSDIMYTKTLMAVYEVL
jgi:hypothetical protein